MFKKRNLFLLFFILLQTAFSQKEITEIKEYVTDNVGIFKSEELYSLQNKLKEIDTRTTNQIVVLVINDLQGEYIESYANKVFNENKIGQEKEDNGVLIFIATNDRRVRIEVGSGLEHILTDAKSSRIIREVIIPQFKKQNYYKSIDVSITMIDTLISGDFDTKKEQRETNQKVRSEDSFFVKIIKDIGFVIFIGAFLFGLLFVMMKFFFVKVFENLIDLYRGLIVGKIGVLNFIPMFLMTAFFILMMILPMVLGTILGFWFFLNTIIIEKYIVKFSLFGFIKENVILSIVIGISIIVFTLFIGPFLMAFFNRKHVAGLALKLSFKTDKDYVKKYIPLSGFGHSSSGSSSYSSSSSSYSSSSSSGSFSGGGGSSGGGGASGIW